MISTAKFNRPYGTETERYAPFLPHRERHDSTLQCRTVSGADD